MNTETLDGRSVRASRKRSERREAILRAALEQFSKKGFQGTSVADVIEAAGVSRGTFYLYFDGIDAIFHELLDSFITELMSAIRVVKQEDGQPVEQLYANLRRVIDLLFNKRDLTVILLREAIPFNETVERKLTHLQQFLQRNIAGALRNGAEWGLTRKVNEPIIAMAIIGCIKEVLYQHLVVRNTEVVDREEIARELLSFGLMGLANSVHT